MRGGIVVPSSTKTFLIIVCYPIFVFPEFRILIIENIYLSFDIVFHGLYFLNSFDYLTLTFNEDELLEEGTLVCFLVSFTRIWSNSIHK